MNKKGVGILILYVFAFMNTTIGQEQDFSVKGYFEEIKEGKKIFLQYYYNKIYHKDSINLTDGSFEFKGKISEPIKATLTIKERNKMGRPREIFIEPTVMTTINAVDNLEKALVEGGEVQGDFNILRKRLEQQDEAYRLLVDEYTTFRNAKDTAAMKNKSAQIQGVQKEKRKITKDFIKEHPSSYVGLVLLSEMSYMINEEFLEMYNLLDAKPLNSPKGKILSTEVAVAKKSFVGQPMMNFSQKDSLGNEFNLASLKGKYVLVDFWASWCGPCRADNPNLVKAYTAFKDKNFEILGVSLDEKKERWLAAIKKDELPWLHVSDLKGWKNEVAVMFGIRSIPQNYLINPDGIIVAKNLHGENLESTLRNIIGSQ